VTNARIRVVLVLGLLVGTLGLVAGATAEGPEKLMPHQQPVGEGGELGALAYDSFDNPGYTYTPVQVPPSGVYYRQAGLNPTGTKLVAQKSWTESSVSKTEIVLMDPDGSNETVISPGDSGTGDIYGYMNPFWSDDGTVVGFCEAHNTSPNKIMRYLLATATRDYIYQPVAPDDVSNPDFVGSSTTTIVFWAYGTGGSVADLFIWDGSTLTNITDSADYKEYEPVSNADGSVIVYWSGETTAEPTNTTHTLTNVGGTWTKDVGFTPIADTYWSYWSGTPDNLIATTVMSSKDVHIYTSTGSFFDDLTGPGYSGGSGQWNFVGSMPEGPDGQWLMTSNAGRGSTLGRDIVMARPVLPVWTRYSGNPVVTGSMALDPCVLNEGGTYKMWYTHVDNSGNWTIYYATSADGISWSAGSQALGPSGTSGAYDEVRVAGPSVINDGGTYKMWFSARDANAVWTVGYATSGDGVSWTKVGKVLDVGAAGSWDSEMVREAWVIKDGTTYKMWYAGTAVWPAFKIGYATSSDGTTWTKHASNPIFTGASGGWDGFQVYAPSVVLDGSTYHLYFSGTDGDASGVWSTGHATSSDGLTWVEADRNPVLIPDGTDDSLDYVSAMNDGGTWKLWYSYGGSYAIGLATLDDSTELYLDPTVASIQNDNSQTQAFTVRIANAADMYGYQFVITFDKDNLECTTAAFVDTFLTNPMGVPGGWNAVIDNGAGTVKFARSRQNPDAGISGSGPLATLTFRSTSGAAAGRYKLDFSQTKLGDIDGNELPQTTQYAWLTLYGVGTLSGSVDLQGRADDSGGTVTVMSAYGYLQSQTITASDGSWSFSNVPAGAYQVNIEMERYLDAEKGDLSSTVSVSAGGTTTLGKVKMLGGDANDDDHVDVSDAAIIGGQFGHSGGSITDQRADINNDAWVDILDLVLLGGNYDKYGPVPWS